MIKSLILTLAFLCLSSCGNFFTLEQTQQLFKDNILGKPDLDVTKELFDSFEYSFAKIKVGKSSPIIVVLVSADKDLMHWISSERVSFYTVHGKIIKTSGLDHDINYLDYPITQKISNIVNIDESYQIDFLNPQLYSALSLSRFEFKDNRIINYLEDDIQTITYSELLSMPQINWRHTNQYIWSSDYNKVIKTIQKFHPFVDEIVMEFYYKK
ncbi:YjbF family lipoprotein [Gammaproteobacteria bacterium]|nr:YjbF family lipoprotein [Gammaproteobacteria bacterium]MDB2677777.1 YjbF family lipoprotein [Gammaproteobacteria bacterium]MDC3228718.1 YjbF family lipoprotein [Gammaproteobacteria bacterium]|tara:strand:- start:230 stop:865 length:636 start_codon:yes stop_codon:yes gene_type:complete